jgi:sec-independent protein translocase protein TatA
MGLTHRTREVGFQSGVSRGDSKENPEPGIPVAELQRKAPGGSAAVAARYHGLVLGNIGPLEIVVVLIIALVVFGPKRLPELGRSLGKGIREFRGSLGGDNDDEEKQPGQREIEAGEREPVAPKRS